LETKSRENELSLDRIDLANLSIESVCQVIKDLLGCEDVRAYKLEVCMNKTDENPFFLRHFLTLLCDMKLLQFNFGSLSWKWDEREITSRTQSTDNAVDLLQQKMNSLPDELLALLKLAVCLGSPFDEKNLLLLCRSSAETKSVDEDEELMLARLHLAPSYDEAETSREEDIEVIAFRGEQETIRVFDGDTNF
jgi:predicted ATPase